LHKPDLLLTIKILFGFKQFYFNTPPAYPFLQYSFQWSTRNWIPDTVSGCQNHHWGYEWKKETANYKVSAKKKAASTSCLKAMKTIKQCSENRKLETIKSS